MPSWWGAIKGHGMLFIATTTVFSYYSPYILNNHGLTQLIFASPYPSFPSVFSRLLLLSPWWSGFCWDRSSLPCIFDSGVFLLLPSDVCETLDNMSVGEVFCDSGVDIALGCMAYCCSPDVEWPRCTASWSPCEVNMGEVSDDPSRSTCLTSCLNADGKLKDDRILSVSPGRFVPGHLIPFPTIHERVLHWLSEYHPSEVPGSSRP